MSSRSGPGSHRNRSNDSQDEFPPLPTPRFPPSLRTLNSPRERDGNPSSSARNQGRYWSTASRRAERIRNLEERPAGSHDHDRSGDQTWSAPRRRPSRARHAETRDTNFEEDLDRSLDEANAHLRVLLDLSAHPTLTSPLPPLPVTYYTPQLRNRELADEHRRNKRRKLESDKLAPKFKGFRYGKYGQVEPGQLKMEIVSCDGGMFSNESVYAADNILKDDTSVYCTKGNRCNIVLCHQGATVFTLQELVIKAPGSMNYSHPIREGMVFVAMTQDEVLSRTAQYQIQYAPRCGQPPFPGQDDGGALERDPYDVISIRHHEDGTTTSMPWRTSLLNEDDDEMDSRLAQMPREFRGNQPDFRITTECSDAEEEEYNTSSRPYRPPPNRIGSLPFETGGSDSDDPDGFNPGTYMDRLQRARNHSSLSLTEAWEAHATATQEAVRAVGGELLVPHAHFFIEKKKSKCTIRFDPPVSGRFILLKIWSSHHDPASNIDIQSVMARGFAGPRYFPSIQLC
ncbi:hypothetical protein S7711_06691 [Stachybotrys chartarum IBT 7711]|uniref:Uncharacterized protein n=1 Tax=Stachybotrys chartarum (strain CBS 109288 / IBT 7711) TaxID=1280523 RepID=A0A084APJ3_STACB|nr:hypothetical protein S7711_06691 [Stachybotrys chartarum IBT 7711]